MVSVVCRSCILGMEFGSCEEFFQKFFFCAENFQ